MSDKPANSASIRDAFIAGYNAGWESTGEGHNAEYSRPTFTHERYEAERDDAFAAFVIQLQVERAKGAR